MKRARALLMAMIIGSASLTGTAAWADRGYYRPYDGPRHHHHGHGGGRALGWGIAGLALGSAVLWAATRPPVVVQEPAQVYMPPPPMEPVVAYSPPADGWWYYCRSAGAYYPYVKHCAGGWERVSPRANY